MASLADILCLYGIRELLSATCDLGPLESLLHSVPELASPGGDVVQQFPGHSAVVILLSAAHTTETLQTLPGNEQTVLEMEL